MAKTEKTAVAVAVELVPGKSEDVNAFAFREQAAGLAGQLSVDLAGSTADRFSWAVHHINASQRSMLAAGLLLESIRSECEHGEFLALLKERGCEPRTAQLAMQYARFVLSRPEDERPRLIEMPKYKVLALAAAEPEVVQAVMDDADAPIEGLSIRALNERIGDLKRIQADLQVQRDKAEAQAEGLRKQIARMSGEREDGVPVAVAGLRAELVVSQKKAQLALEALGAAGDDLAALLGKPEQPWADASLRLGIAAAAAIALQLQGVMQRLLHLAPGVEAGLPQMASLTQQELVDVAQLFRREVSVDALERAMRRRDHINAAKDEQRSRGRRRTQPVWKEQQ